MANTGENGGGAVPSDANPQSPPTVEVGAAVVANGHMHAVGATNGASEGSAELQAATATSNGAAADAADSASSHSSRPASAAQSDGDDDDDASLSEGSLDGSPPDESEAEVESRPPTPDAPRQIKPGDCVWAKYGSVRCILSPRTLQAYLFRRRWMYCE
jgi:hypothetical protein